MKPIWHTWSRKASPLWLSSLHALTGCDTSRHIQGNGKRKGMFHNLSWFKPHGGSRCTYWAWRRSWTVSWRAQVMQRIIVLTVFCLKQLHVSQYNTLWWHLQTTENRSRIGQTPNYSECLVWTHPPLKGPGIAILCIKCNYHWLCVLTLVIFGTIAQFDADKTVSVARAPAWTLAGGFNVIGPMHASNELKNLPHEHVLPWLAMAVACHLALSSKLERVWVDMVNEQQLRRHNDVWSHTPRVGGSLSTHWSDFSCLKRCHPRVFVWDLWSCLGQQSEYKNDSHPVTTTTDGSASSPSSISAARTLELASRKPVKHPFSLSLHPAESQEQDISVLWVHVDLLSLSCNF